MNFYDFKVKDTKGNDVPLSDYKGKVLLIVNTATGCGFTPQYEDLQALYEKYHNNGFEILDFPCNQFGAQAPGNAEEIENFCTINYGTTFLRFAKTEVIGENASPLFRYLTQNTRFEGFDPSHPITALLEQLLSDADPGYKTKSDIKWNFTKFLIDRNGSIVNRFEPTNNIENISSKIAEILK
jgi:glutathione peroxidase